MQPLLVSLTAFFQEYDIKRLSPEIDSHTIIERVLQFGDRAEIKWLFTTYSQEQIVSWVERFGRERPPQPHLNFWNLILETNR